MVQFTLELDFDDVALANIAAAQQRVTIVRRVSTFVHSEQTTFDAPLLEGSPHPNAVAWLAFRPSEKNRLCWTDQVELFASASIPAETGPLIPNSRTDGVTPRHTATLQDGFFTLTKTAGLRGYRARNDAPASLTWFGLIGSATLDGIARDASPMSIEPVLRGQIADFIFHPGTITILLTNAASDGWLMPPVDIAGLPVTLDEQNPGASVSFDDDTNTFFMN